MHSLKLQPIRGEIVLGILLGLVAHSLISIFVRIEVVLTFFINKERIHGVVTRIERFDWSELSETKGARTSALLLAADRIAFDNLTCNCVRWPKGV